jgi:hypothetical protein
MDNFYKTPISHYFDNIFYPLSMMNRFLNQKELVLKVHCRNLLLPLGSVAWLLPAISNTES